MQTFKILDTDGNVFKTIKADFYIKEGALYCFYQNKTLIASVVANGSFTIIGENDQSTSNKSLLLD